MNYSLIKLTKNITWVFKILFCITYEVCQRVNYVWVYMRDKLQNEIAYGEALTDFFKVKIMY